MSIAKSVLGHADTQSNCSDELQESLLVWIFPDYDTNETFTKTLQVTRPDTIEKLLFKVYSSYLVYIGQFFLPLETK